MTKVRQAYLSHSGIAKSEHNIHFILPAYKDSLSGLGSSNANRGHPTKIYNPCLEYQGLDHGVKWKTFLICFWN